MIISEQVQINGVDFMHTYSDKGYQVMNIYTREIFDDVYDLISHPNTYAEVIPEDEKQEEMVEEPQMNEEEIKVEE